VPNPEDISKFEIAYSERRDIVQEGANHRLVALARGMKAGRFVPWSSKIESATEVERIGDNQ